MVITEALTYAQLEKMAQMDPEDERCKVGVCPYCGEVRDDLLKTHAGDLRCSECDNNHHWCSICKEELGEYDDCRHTFYDHWHCSCEWLGSGSWNVHDAYWMTRIKRGLFNLLRAVPFACELRAAIKANNFYMFILDGMIGRPMVEVNGLEEPDGSRLFSSFDTDDKIMQAMEEDCDDDKQYINVAAHWLLSLYKNKTPDANRITVSWIEEWLASQTNRLLGPAVLAE